MLNKYFKYFEELSDSLVIVEPETSKIVDFNKQAYKYLGYTKEEFIKLKISDIDYYDSDQDINNKKVTFEKNTFTEFQTKHIRKNGALCDVIVKVKRIEIEEKAFFLVIIHDISELNKKTKQLERAIDGYRKQHRKLIEQFDFTESLINTAETIILVLDSKGNIVRFNPYMEKLSGYKLDEVKGKNWFSTFLPKRKQKKVQEAFNHVIMDIDVNGTVNPIITKSGTKKDIIWYNTVLKARDNTIKGILSIGIDHTERKKLEEKLRRTNKKLEKSNSIKSKFLSNMNHEIRTPLNGILGIVDILAETKLSDEQHKLLDFIKDSSTHLLNIAIETLDYSKIESGSISINNNSFDINTILDEINFLFKLEAAKKNLDFFLKQKCLIDIPLHGDSFKLKQILVNLCSNAVKFTHEGFVKLSFIIGAETDTNITAIFTVKDTGIGIKEKNIKKLFKQFTQIAPPNTGKYPGIGMGLAISKELAELMGGFIEVESKVGEGSTFRLIIPLEKVIESKEKGSTALIKKHINKKILIAEDNPINSFIEEKMLNKMGYEDVDIVKDGKEALAFFKQNKYDIIFMDCLMPEMTGTKSAKEIRNFEKDNEYTPIIAITANGKEWTKTKCLESGMDDYLEKPISQSALMKILCKYL